MVVTIFVLFLQYYEKTFTAVAVKLNCRPVGHGCYIRLVAARSSSFIYTVVLSMGRAMGGGYRSLWIPNNLGKAPDPHYMAPKPRFWLPLFSMAPLWCCLLLIKPVCRPIYTAAVHISVWFSLVLTCCNGVAESCEVTFLRRWLQGWKCCGPHFWATQSAAGKVYERRECDLATW